MRALGFAVVIVSNQSGVARGLFDEAAVEAVDRRVAELLRLADPSAVIDLNLYCPFHPEAVVPALPAAQRAPQAGTRHAAASGRAARFGPVPQLGDR